VARRHPTAVPLAELAGAAWTTGHTGMGWEEMTQRTCRQHGGFDPDIRYRTNDATVSLALVARGMAVTLFPTSSCRLAMRIWPCGGSPRRLSIERSSPLRASPTPRARRRGRSSMRCAR
jgi:DNA-binding transcriptional LysR family regulator